MRDGDHGMDAHPGLLVFDGLTRRIAGGSAVCRFITSYHRPPQLATRIFPSSDGSYGVRRPTSQKFSELPSRGIPLSMQMFPAVSGRLVPRTQRLPGVSGLFSNAVQTRITAT